MADRSNLAIWNGGRPTISACATLEKSIMPQHKANHIGNQYTHQDWDDLDHALSPHIAGNDNDHRKSRQPPVFRGVGYSTGRQNQSDQNDDRAGDYRRQKSHYPLNANNFDDRGQDQIQKACHYNATAGIR